MANASVGLLLGLAAGVLMAFLAVDCMGWGHGTYVPAGLTSAPFGFLGAFIALLGAPVLWAFLGALCGLARDGYTTKILPVVLGVHYVSGGVLVTVGGFSDWGYFRSALTRAPVSAWGWAFVFAGSHLALWYLYLTRAE